MRCIAEFDLSERLAQEASQLVLEGQLSVFKESQRIYNEIVREGKRKVDEQLENKLKQNRAAKKIERSSYINALRMKKATLKFELCESIFAQVERQLQLITRQAQHQQFYKQVLFSYILEGTQDLNEPCCTIKCLQRDKAMVQELLPICKDTYREMSRDLYGQEEIVSYCIQDREQLIERDLDLETNLNKNQEDKKAIGGIILSDQTGNITFKNTFDSRVKILKEDSTPLIRAMLWAPQNLSFI